MTNDEPTRHSICISQTDPLLTRHQGDAGFHEILRQHYADAESIALEQLVQLKARLRIASEEDFWRIFSEGLSRILGSQYVITAQKLDDSPAVGLEGSCLTAVCWFYNDGHGIDGFAKGVNYHAYSCPCAEMRHGKAFLVPGRVNELFPNNPNAPGLPIPMEAYFAIPVIDVDREVGHLALIWSPEGLSNKKLSWGFMETLMRSLEDIIARHLTEGPGLAKQAKVVDEHQVEAIVPLRMLSELRSLRPYAKSLSHELRTPMQGIVGMLDVMYANCQEALELDTSSKMQTLIEELKSSIETIQDSSRRAVDAADNVVEAYALNMGIPDGNPLVEPQAEVASKETEFSKARPSPRQKPRPALQGARGVKRRSDDDLHVGGHRSKIRLSEEPSDHAGRDSDSDARASTINKAQDVDRYSPSILEETGHSMQYINVREMVDYVVNESLRSGGRPESSAATTTSQGQIIEVHSRLGDGSIRNKTITWTVQDAVPQHILADERAMAKTISCVFHNALKFTETGRISLDVNISASSKTLVVVIADTGSGIPENFQEKIFKAYSQADESITRHSEGLGLGLLIAKGLAQKMGGDLDLIRSNIDGPDKGTTFELRVPVPRSPSGSVSPTSTSNDDNSLSHSSRVQSTTSSSSSVTQVESSTQHLAQVLPRSPPQSPIPAQEICAPCSLVQIPLPIHAPITPSPSRPKLGKGASFAFDRKLAQSCPLTFLVAEDNIINRKLLVNMLVKLGYDPKTQIYEAYDGADAVAQIHSASQQQSLGEGERTKGPVDVILMDLWMPRMDGYEATERILNMFRPGMARRSITAPGRLPTAQSFTKSVDGDCDLDEAVEAMDEGAVPTRLPSVSSGVLPPTILAVTADATDGAAERAKSAGMQGFMVKPFRVQDLERLVKEGFSKREAIWQERGGRPMLAV